jgi:predicted DNA-binding transcriptional regulator
MFFYVCVLAVMGVYSFMIWHARRIRIMKICHELNITKYEYEKIVKKYYYENYYPDIKDYINSILEDK